MRPLYDNTDAIMMGRRTMARIHLRGAWMRRLVECGVLGEADVRSWFGGYAVDTSKGAYLVGYLFGASPFYPLVEFAHPEHDGERSEWAFDRDGVLLNIAN